MQVTLTPNVAKAVCIKTGEALKNCNLANSADKLDELIMHTKRIADCSEKSFTLSEEATRASQEMFKRNALTGGLLEKIGHQLSIFLPVGLVTGLVSSVTLPVITAWLYKFGII